jgi:cell division initiation protein
MQDLGMDDEPLGDDDLSLVDEAGGGSAQPEGASARIRTVRFREKLRGYHPDDVDDFLEQLALLVDDLEARVTDLTARLEEARSRGAVASVNEQTVRRTLVLAQRTAELAVTEAQNRAASIVAEAEEQARSRVEAVEAEVLSVREAEEARLREDLERLEGARADVERDLAAMEARRAEERARLSEALQELSSVVDARLTPPD